jgi:hypothetical protein
MKIATYSIMALAALAGAAALPQPVMAQGTLSPVERAGSCPNGWNGGSVTKGQDAGYCYASKDAPMVYRRAAGEECTSGYSQDGYYCTTKPASEGGGSASDQLVSYGTVKKANRLDRCPLGYFSKDDMTTCTTWLSPAPQSRRKSGPCKSNEIDEWGLYCTANANVITREQAEREAVRDFNAIYSENGANPPAQGSDTDSYPSMVAAYGPRPAKGSSASSASSSEATDQTAQSAQNAACQEGSATGAAIGGALGGDAGAALGSMLGGLGKKKKKKTC